MSCVSVNGSRPGEAQQRLDLRHDARREALHRLGDGADVVGRRAAAAAENIDEAGLREFADELRHIFRALVIEAEFIGQAGVGKGADARVGDAADLGDMLRASRARRARN